jgi:hypothetical protein
MSTPVTRTAWSTAVAIRINAAVTGITGRSITSVVRAQVEEPHGEEVQGHRNRHGGGCLRT